MGPFDDLWQQLGDLGNPSGTNPVSTPSNGISENQWLSLLNGFSNLAGGFLNQQNSQQAPPPPPPPPQDNSNKWLIIGGAIAVLIIGVLIFKK